MTRKFVGFLIGFSPFFVASYVLLTIGIKITDWEYWVILFCIFGEGLLEWHKGRAEA